MTTPARPGPSLSRHAVFLDRDGTLNVERNYLGDPDQLELFPEVGPALHRLQEAGFLLLIVTNQSGIGRGYYTEADMHRVNARLLEHLAPSGVRIEHIYFAPESPEQPSRGRKPAPDYLFDARDTFGLDLARCYMVGDKLADVQCGWNAGVKRSVLVRTGYGAETEERHRATLDRAVCVDTLPDAVDFILRDAGHASG